MNNNIFQIHLETVSEKQFFFQGYLFCFYAIK